MKKLLVFLFAGLMVTSCADEDLGPIVTFDTASKGAYIKLIEEGSRLVNLFDVPGSVYTYSVEFVDFDQGNLVSEYNLDLTVVDNTPDNDNVSAGPIRLKSFSASEFGSTDRGFKGLSGISLSATELIAAAGISADQLGPNDVFRVNGSLTLQDGSVFAGSNSSAAVRGTAFAGHFDFDLTANCPSDLTGSYAYETTDAWCDGSSATGSVDIVAVGGGTYYFSDWSFGAYGPCYGAVADQPGITFAEVCAEVSYTAVVDSYGDTWTFTSSVDGDRWTINWENTYGESANSVVINPNGWAFTLK